MNTTPDHGQPPDVAARRRQAALAGHHGDRDAAIAFLRDDDPGVRATALGALVRLDIVTSDTLQQLVDDPAASVRRRLAEEIGRHHNSLAPSHTASQLRSAVTEGEILLTLLGDDDALVAEAAAWALGELVSSDAADLPPPFARNAVDALGHTATGHDDALVREAAVAALGAIGDPASVDSVLTATSDKPAVRRRAVIALAAFLGEPGVDEALNRATTDRDWQVRQAAAVLLDPHR